MPYAVPEEPTYAAKAENIVKSNPDLIQEPSAVHALASTPGVDGQTLGQVSAFANHIGNIKEAIGGHANSSPEGHGFWSDVTNFVHTLGKDISGIPALLDPSLFSGMPAEQRTGYQNAVVSGYNSVAHGTLNALERAASTATEAATGGFLGPKGVGAFSANQADLEQTFKNLVNVPKNWRLGKTAMAYIDSLRNKKGDLYAMYYTLPSVIAAVSGDEVIAGGGAAKDAETMAALAAKINAGEGDAETIARFMAASSRSARKFSAQNLPEDAAASTLEDSAKAEKPSSFVGKGTADKAISAFNRGKDFFQTASRWTLGPLAKAGKGYLKAVSDPRLFGTYVSLQQQAMQDPMTRALWQAAEQGIVLDSRGMPMNITPGQSLANSIGLYRGDFGYNLVSGAADLGAFISSDPFSPAFNVLDAANSAQGVGGILGKWWTGLGVETGADVERLAGSNVRNRRAFEYMATHSESEIRKMFKGMYSDNLFQQLGRAKTWDQVVAIHADIADGAALTGYVLPTTKVMRLGLRAIAEGLGKVIDAGKSITGRGIPSTDFIQAIEIMNDELVKAGFEPIATDAVTQAETSELAALARGSIRRKIDALSTEAIWKINEAEKLGEVPSISNYAFRLGDKSAIPLIQRQFLITGQFNHRIIEALGQVLSAAKTETEFGNALVNLSTVAVSGQLGRMVGEKYWALRDMFESMIRSDFENFYGFRGGGAFKARRIFNNGPEGEAMSTFVDPTDPTRIGMYGNTWEHIRQGRFVDPREIKGMLSRYAAAAKAADDTVVNRVAEARMMDESALERVAQYKNAVVKDARTEMGDQAAARTEGYFKNGQTQEMMGYRDGFERVSAMANRVLGDASLSEAQRYVEYAKGVSNAVTRAAETLTTATEKADQYAAAKEAADNASKLNLPEARQLNENLRGMFTVPPEQLAQMRGELQALMDMEYKVYGKIQEYGVTAKDFNQLTEALGLGNATEEERAAKQALVDKMRKYRSENISFLSGRNKLADGLNKALSWTFIPAALSTAAYLTRVAASEAFVNISRMGVATYIEARLAASIVKHESNYVPLQSVKNAFAESEGAIRSAKIAKDINVVNKADFVVSTQEAHAQLIRDANELERRVKANAEIRFRSLEERPSGYTAMLSRLIREVTQRGENIGLDQNEINVVSDFIRNVNASLFEDVRLSIRASAYPENKMGQYNFSNGLITLFGRALLSPNGVSRTMIHELWHHLSNFISDEEISIFEKELQTAREKFLKNNPVDDFAKFFEQHPVYPSETKLVQSLKYEIQSLKYEIQSGFEKYAATKNVSDIPWDKLPGSYLTSAGYRLTNTDEWFAESMYDRFYRRIETGNKIIEAGHTILVALLNIMRRLFKGRTSLDIFNDFMKQRYEATPVSGWNSIEGRINGIENPTAMMRMSRGDTPESISEVQLLTRESMRLANILMDTAKTTKAFMIGALTGTERGILEGMNPERFERMLADFAMFLKSTNGHLADVGHGVNQLYGTSREVAAMSEMAYGVDKNGDKAISGTRMVGQGFTRADKSHIASALSKQLRLINQSSMYNPIARDIEDMVVRNGRTYSGAEADRAFEMLLDKQVNRLKSMPEGELEAFGANGKLLASGSTGDPLRDFAKSQVYHVWHTLSGLRPVLGVGQESIFHPELIDQAISGLVKSEPELAKDYVAAKGMYPMHVIASADARETWETTGARKFIRIFRTALELPRTLNEVVLDRHFGHLISWISREPVFLWEAHVAMEEARQMVADNLMTHDQAIVQALNRGFTRMVKYVHNPADRFAFEQYTRMYSPFWFAKNQAYRRAFRLLEEDPAAFVKYMRMNLRATQYFQNIQNKNQSYIVLPGGTEVSQTAVNIAAGGNDMLGAFFNNIGFSIFGDPTSVQTVDPLGSNTGGRMVENILRPDPGPYVSVVTKLLTKTLAEHHVIDPAAHADALRWLLGPIDSQTGILSDIYPSSFWRNTAVLIGDVIATNVFGGNVTFDYVAQTQTEAIHEAMTNMLSIYIDEYKAINNITKPTDQQNLDALHYAEQQMSVWFNEGNHRQDFINRAHTAALGLSAAKLLTSFFLPIAPVLRAKFATSDFNKYVNQKMPDGSPIPYSEAVYQFALKEPQNFLDTISGSQSPYGPFPETQVFLKWSNGAPNLLNPDNGYPNFLAYAIPRQGGYLPGVFQTQVSMGLRKADTPQEYIDTVLTQLGNDFYYGQLLPQYYTEYGAYYGPNDPRNTISYEGYKQLKTAAQNWGNYNNPTWLQFGSPFGTLARPKEIKAIQQLQSFLNDTPAQQQVVRDGLFTQDNINTLRVALSIYNQRIKEIQAITSSSGKWSVEQELSSLMNGIAANPDNKNIAYFLTEVLAKAPTK